MSAQLPSNHPLQPTKSRLNTGPVKASHPACMRHLHCVWCEKRTSRPEVLIQQSVRALQAPFYSPAQMEAALGLVFGVDRQLVSDGTYFVVEHSGHIVGCGGWGHHNRRCDRNARRRSSTDGQDLQTR
jgi:hypothetical protein